MITSTCQSVGVWFASLTRVCVFAVRLVVEKNPPEWLHTQEVHRGSLYANGFYQEGVAMSTIVSSLVGVRVERRAVAVRRLVCGVCGREITKGERIVSSGAVSERGRVDYSVPLHPGCAKVRS